MARLEAQMGGGGTIVLYADPCPVKGMSSICMSSVSHVSVKRCLTALMEKQGRPTHVHYLDLWNAWGAKGKQRRLTNEGGEEAHSANRASSQETKVKD